MFFGLTLDCSLIGLTNVTLHTIGIECNNPRKNGQVNPSVTFSSHSNAARSSGCDV